MTGYPRIDRVALHVYLWERTDRRKTIEVQNTKLAELLGLSVFTISRVMHELINAGRVKKVGRAKFAIATYLIRDPADFPADL